MRKAIIAAAILSLAAAATAQTAKAHSRGELLAAARAIMQKARYCTLVTLGEDGHPQARIVDPQTPDAAFAVFIATNPLTRKVKEIERDARVTLMYFDAPSSSYVTVLGRAALVTDAAERDKHWKKEWTPFYPRQGGRRDFTLIRVDPSRLEIVSVARGLVGDSKTWQPLSIDFGGRR